MSVCAVISSSARSLCSQLNKVLLLRKQVLVKISCSLTRRTEGQEGGSESLLL